MPNKEELVQEDGSEMTSLALYAWCRRLLYHWWTAFNPLLATVIVAGMENNERWDMILKKDLFLGIVLIDFLDVLMIKVRAYREFWMITGITNHLTPVNLDL